MESFNQQSWEKVACPRLSSAKSTASNKNFTLPSQFCFEYRSPSLTRKIRMSPLASRAATQTVGFLILFALIFVSAGTIHFWQGWLFCVSFSFSTVATGVYLMRRDPALLERRMRFGPRAESRPRQKIIVAVIFAMFAALLIVPGLDHRFGWSQVPAAIVVLANLLIIAPSVSSSWCYAKIRSQPQRSPSRRHSA